MVLPVQELYNFSDYYSYSQELDDDNLLPKSEQKKEPNGEEKPDDDDDFEENYGDLEDGHDDLNEPESERGVDNLE